MENNVLEADIEVNAERRKKFLINNKVQQTMALEVLLAVFVFVNFMVITAYFTLETAATLSAVREKLALGIAIVEIVGFGSLYYLSVRSSHKAVGPIFNLQNCMKNASQGRVQDRIEIRSTDHFQEIGTEFNALMSEYDKRIHSIQKLVNVIEKSGDNIDKNDVSQLVSDLSWFKTSQP